jgi:SAM-dependent methyltransferase
MMNLLGNFSAGSALKRLIGLLRGVGVARTLWVCAAKMDDQYLRCFDRVYRVRTSGMIDLARTSFDPAKLGCATSYGPVNGWAFRRLLKNLALPKTLHFVDLGCGLGRACILAAEYGFEKVSGVELAPDLCAVARENASHCRLDDSSKARLHIIHGDALEYCEQSDDDVFFIYRAFSFEFFRKVRQQLVERAVRQQKVLTLIYSERLNWPPTCEVRALTADTAFRRFYQTSTWGQSFYVYQCVGTSCAI